MEGHLISIFRVGGVSYLPDGDLTLFSSKREGLEIILTKNMDSVWEIWDVSRALMLASWSGYARKTKEEQTLDFDKKLEIAKKDREKNFKEGVFLVFKGKRRVNYNPKEKLGEILGYFYCFDFDEKLQFIESFEEKVYMAITSLLLSIPDQFSKTFQKVPPLIYLGDKQGKKIFPYREILGSPSLGFSGDFSKSEMKKFGSFWKTVRKDPELKNILSLLVRSKLSSDNKLYSFLLIWTAFEMFVTTFFSKTYKEEIFNQLTKRAPKNTKFFQGKIRREIKRFSLSDKFEIIVALLNNDEKKEDMEVFKKIKVFRDNFIHENLEENIKFPTPETQKLIEKYIKLHLKI